jgi:hypothetical protein
MRNRIMIVVLTLAGLGVSSLAVAQDAPQELIPGPGWKTCPRCTNDLQLEAANERYEVEGHPFDPRDLAGVWGNNGIPLDMSAVPPFTPLGQQLFDATLSPNEFTNAKDGMLICDPLGLPRLFAYNYGFEFMMSSDRVVQFYEWSHLWRNIWIDGRELPEDPPVQRWLGYSVGHWEGDTFVVESTGFDDRSWLSEDRRHRIHGFPHSTALRTIERYTRTSYGIIEAELTIIDPEVFTEPWVTRGEAELYPNAELWEYLCVPSESAEYNERLIETALESGN